VSGSQPPAAAVAAVQPDPEPAGPIAQDTPNRDDHGEFMALVAEIQERQQDGDDRRHRRRSPMYTR
jgi:hypothetical protein